MRFSFRQIVGATVLDWPGFERRLRAGTRPGRAHPPWVEIANRREVLQRSTEGPGVACEAEWTSTLWAPQVFPRLGARLLRRALADWPIDLATRPAPAAGPPEVSFIVGHRGREREPLLLAAIRSIAAQRDCRVELIVVEQSNEPEARPHLPDWVRYLHTPLPDPELPYCRAWAFNAGARIAASDTLVFHDSDLLVPRDYAREVLGMRDLGFDAVDLKRFIFYLSRADSAAAAAAEELPAELTPGPIVQNARGGSLAVDRETFFALGGFDETFVGWGGEDNEFWDRALTRRAYPYGYLPLLHLWHAYQPEKQQPDRFAASHLEARRKLSAEERVEQLRHREIGRPDGPWAEGREPVPFNRESDPEAGPS